MNALLNPQDDFTPHVIEDESNRFIMHRGQ